MDKIIHDEEYNAIVSSILSKDEFSGKMGKIKHHDSTRLNHSLKVSYYSYKIAKYLRLDYEQVARAGLLHDFYLDSVYEQETVKDKFLLYTTRHPAVAVENAKELFSLTDKEEDIIRTHMFPLDVRVPKYAESWVVNLVDKGVSTSEFSHKFGHQLMYIVNFYVIFFLHSMKIG